MSGGTLENALQSVRAAFPRDERKIGLLYSGGKDSTAVLLAVAKEFPDAELSLFALNNGCMYPEEIKAKVREKLELLTARGFVRNRVTATYLDARDILGYLGFRSFHDDMRTYPTGLLCCACKIAMHYITAKHCAGLGIATIADGYSHFERFLPGQLPEFRDAIAGPIAEKYGVRIVSPLYHVFDSATAPMEIISSFGLDPQLFLGENKGQGLCMLGLLYKIPYEVNDSDEAGNEFFIALRKAVTEYATVKRRFISGEAEYAVTKHDSYGNRRMVVIDFDQMMDGIIEKREIFFDAAGAA